jgi:hypothetical protein
MATPSMHARAQHHQPARITTMWQRTAAILVSLFMVVAMAPASASAAPASQDAASPSGLRDQFNFLAQEHVYLVSATLGDLLRGDTVAYDGALTRFNDNSVRLSETIGTIYGPQAQMTFRQLWQAHYDGYLDYALAASEHDAGKKTEAKGSLDRNRDDLGAFFASVNPYLRKADVSASLRDNVDQITGAIDAMSDQEWGKAFSQIHLAAHGSADFADPISEAIAQQFPEQLEGGVTGPSAEMSSAFTRLVQEHVFLSSMTTGALAIGNMPKFEASKVTAEKNTHEISALIGEVYSPDKRDAFESLWNQHLDAYADYTRAQLAGDKDSMEASRAFLTKWVGDTSSLLTTANPFFKQASVASVLSDHVAMTLSGIDAQVARDWPAAYSGLQMGAHQSLDIANIVAGGIVDAFGEQSGAQLLPNAAREQSGAQILPNAAPEQSGAQILPPAPVQPQQAPVQLPRR